MPVQPGCGQQAQRNMHKRTPEGDPEILPGGSPAAYRGQATKGPEQDSIGRQTVMPSAKNVTKFMNHHGGKKNQQKKRLKLHVRAPEKLQNHVDQERPMDFDVDAKQASTAETPLGK